MTEEKKEKPMAMYTFEYAAKHQVCQYCGKLVAIIKGEGYYEGKVYAHRVCHGLPPFHKVILACEFELEEWEVVHGFKLETYTRANGLSEVWKMRSYGNWERGRKFKGCPKVIQMGDTSIGLTVAHLMTRDEMMALIEKHINPLYELESLGMEKFIDVAPFLKALGFKGTEAIDTEGMDKPKPLKPQMIKEGTANHDPNYKGK